MIYHCSLFLAQNKIGLKAHSPTPLPKLGRYYGVRLTDTKGTTRITLCQEGSNLPITGCTYAGLPETGVVRVFCLSVYQYATQKKVVWLLRISFTIVQTLSARSISQHIHGASNSLDGRKIPMALLGPRLRP